MLDVAKTFFTYFVWFYLGRCSYTFWKNKYLETKRMELLKLAEELAEFEHHLEEKDSEIRVKWQAMVDDFSKYQAAIQPETSGKWSEWDDVYLNSWGSAEK